MTPGRFSLASQVGRVPSMTVPLDARQESRFHRLMEESVMIDLHQHPMVMPEDFTSTGTTCEAATTSRDMTRSRKGDSPPSGRQTPFAGF